MKTFHKFNVKHYMSAKRIKQKCRSSLGFGRILGEGTLPALLLALAWLSSYSVSGLSLAPFKVLEVKR